MRQLETEAPKGAFNDDGTPYYVQLASFLRRGIANETWSVGDQLPTLKQMVSEYGVAPMTVRRALGVLEAEGLITLHRGRGTFVAARPSSPGVVSRELTNFATPDGEPLVSKLVALRPARDELRILPDEGKALPPYRYLKRTSTASGQQYNFGEFLIAESLFRLLPEERWRRELLSPLLVEAKEIPLASVRQILRVHWATAEEAAELSIRTNEPVVHVRRIFLNKDHEVLCLGQLVYRADRIRFDINLDLDDRTRVLELSGYPERTL